jgi:hypothetical protein
MANPAIYMVKLRIKEGLIEKKSTRAVNNCEPIMILSIKQENTIPSRKNSL